MIYYKDKLILNEAKDLPLTSKDEVIPPIPPVPPEFTCGRPPYKLRRKYIPLVKLPKDAEAVPKLGNKGPRKERGEGILKKLPETLVLPKKPMKSRIIPASNISRENTMKDAINFAEVPIAPVKSPEHIESVSSITLGGHKSIETTPNDTIVDKYNPLNWEERPKEDKIAMTLLKIKRELKPENPCILVWSGEEILPHTKYLHAKVQTEYMSNIKVWRKDYQGYVKKWQHVVKRIMKHPSVFWLFMFGCLFNTTLLALNRYGQSQSESKLIFNISTVFMYVFLIEIVLKVFGFGMVKFCSDPLNCINACVGIMNIIEIIFADSLRSSNISVSFQAFNTLRIFKVMRMLRLLKPMKSMKILLQVIGSAISSFVYTSLLLLLFLFIYSLFGMQLFGGRFDFPEGRPRQHYDSFFDSLLCVFQLLTIQSWDELHYSSLRAQIPAVTVAFYVTWLLIGNYILLSLFLAIMLNMFAEADDEDKGEDSVVRLALT